MLAVFRSSAVLVPQTADGLVWSGDGGGIRWIYAFSSEPELAAFLTARAEGPGEVRYLTVFGARLLDVAVPAAGVPCGVALDVAGAQPMLFPPVVGIVPDAAAVDADHGRTSVVGGGGVV
ncbi:SseB family protein [Kitasatospora sp. KL5]|uniref:SseB family protein n=1 Tax=Kitasatospora sp. KL5 TaxID=3425125 RepID=UPI003D6EF549